MTSILSVEEIIEKLNSLKKNSLPRWGEMSSSQMIKHCSSFIDLYLGKIKVPFWYKYFGTTIGKLFLSYISKKSPLETPKNIRTEKAIIISEANPKGEFDWIIHRAKQTPAPHDYNLGSTLNLKRGVTFTSSNAKSETESIIHRSASLPAPNTYYPFVNGDPRGSR